LKSFAYCDEPPAHGELIWELQARPVSLQARRPHKEALTTQLRHSLTGVKYLLTGDVAVRIEWSLQERERYETGTSPDVDNVIKVILDSLSGPEGLLVDDCQVQSVACSWIDWGRDVQRIALRITAIPDAYMYKTGLVFVRLSNGLCVPIHCTLGESSIRILDAVETMIAHGMELEGLGASYGAVRGVLPIQRWYHPARLTRFRVLSRVEFRALALA